MALYVHLHVCFACSGPGGVSELARACLPGAEREVARLEAADVAPRGADEAVQLLEYVAAGRGITHGAKGALLMWGLVGNYTNPDRFVDVLRPFWTELLSHNSTDPDWEGPAYYEHVLVFYEPEGAGFASAIEILADEWPGKHGRRNPNVRLLTRKHERLPFAWMQR